MAKGNKKEKQTKEMKRSTYRVMKTLFILFLVIIILIVGAFIAVHAIFNFDREKDPEKKPGEVNIIEQGNEELAADVQVDMLEALKNSDSLETILREWAQNNTDNSLMRSNDVINFLLVGIDNGGDNTDVMMLVSLNQSTRKIVLTSIMRDSYTYIDTGDYAYCSKINAAYAGGGMNCLINTIQNDYKIKIDHYVSVGFDTFIKIVDILGGVKVPLQYYEAREMERIGKYSEESRVTEYGDEVLLNGYQSLLYCRIRKCDTDGDVSRTRRQRQFISSLIQEFKDIDVSQGTSLLKTLLEYVKTDCSTSELISLGTKAVVNKWYNYDLSSQAYPLEENRMDYRGNAWIWVVDYPADAVALQKAIYGKTNIVMPDDRVTAIDIMSR